jgi:hypothetical protein
LSLLYAAGERPSAADLARLLDEPVGDPGQSARISHQPDESEGWLELLASGLTFDLSNLAPAASVLPTPASHFFGLPANISGTKLEAVTLAAGEHVAPGVTMLPVVRVMCGLCARLTSLGNVKAVCWQPAQSWMEPAYFKRIIATWLGGGAFPALGLTALEQTPEGAFQSRGLAFFTGQEVRVDARNGEATAVTAKLAIRLIDLLVRHGRVREAFDIPGRDGGSLLVEPVLGGEIARVSRGK